MTLKYFLILYFKNYRHMLLIYQYTNMNIFAIKYIQHRRLILYKNTGKIIEYKNLLRIYFNVHRQSNYKERCNNSRVQQKCKQSRQLQRVPSPPSMISIISQTQRIQSDAAPKAYSIHSMVGLGVVAFCKQQLLEIN